VLNARRDSCFLTDESEMGGGKEIDFVPTRAKFFCKNDGDTLDSASGRDHLRFIDWLVKRETDFHKIL